MKAIQFKKILALLLPGLLSCLWMNAQVASWSFNNVLTGTGSANAVAGNASLGSTIAAGGAFNGGTVYYGEGAWPAGAIDLNAYLEFSITPTAGHTVTVSSLVMQIRRSTTGTSGAGPNSWSLRSNLDGYTTDIASGVLGENSTPATSVTLGTSFMNMPSKIIFRLYGFNATVSSGGLDRFVYDDIEALGSTVLPVTFDYFNLRAGNQSADISWKLGGDGDISSLVIERATDGTNFEKIRVYDGSQMNSQNNFEYQDQLNNPSGTYAYRIELVSQDGQISYSSVQTISFDETTGFQMKAVNTGTGGPVNFRVNTEQSGNYVFSLFNLNGYKVAMKSARLDAGSQMMQMDNSPLKSGIYILLAESGNQKISTKIMVL
jgi:Secretion system C-terminal sorting domain